jgi:hypothetical protein
VAEPQRKGLVEGEVLPSEEKVKDEGNLFRDIMRSPAIQAMLAAAAGHASQQPDLDKQKLPQDHEHRLQADKLANAERMQLNHLHYDNLQRAISLGMVLLTVGLVTIAVLAVALMVMLDRGIISTDIFAKVSFVVEAVLVAARLRDIKPPSPLTPQAS